MSKVDVDLPVAIIENPEVLGKVMDLVYAEWERRWPEMVGGGDPTFIYHRGEIRVSYWHERHLDDLMTAFVQGVCAALEVPE